MKRLLLLIAMMALTLSSYSENKVINASQLPAKSLEFVHKWFPDSEIIKAKMEKRASLSQYEIKLDNGSKLQFDNHGSCTEVDCINKEVPAGIVPSKISEYVKSSYPDAIIVKIEHDTKLYEVDLNNGYELTFNASFRLVDVDTDLD